LDTLFVKATRLVQTYVQMRGPIVDLDDNSTSSP
jgi:hypothetical protein